MCFLLDYFRGAGARYSIRERVQIANRTDRTRNHWIHESNYETWSWSRKFEERKIPIWKLISCHNFGLDERQLQCMWMSPCRPKQIQQMCAIIDAGIRKRVSGCLLVIFRVIWQPIFEFRASFSSYEAWILSGFGATLGHEKICGQQSSCDWPRF